MSLPLHNEKAQSVPLPAEVFFFMQNQVTPTYHHVLKLGFGLGGILNILCIPAIAESATAEPVDSEANDLGLIEKSHRWDVREEAEAATGADAIEPQPEALSAQVNVAERRLLISESAFIPEPKLSKPDAKATNGTLANRTLESRTSARRTSEAADPSVFEKRLVHGDSKATHGQAPRFSSSAADDVTPPTVSRQTNRAKAPTGPAVETPIEEPASNAKPEPWSVNRLATSGEHSSVQTLSVSDIQHIGLAWGDTQDNNTSHWLTDLAQAAVEDETPASRAALSEGPESDGLESDGLESDGLESDGLESDGLSSKTIEATDPEATDPEATDPEASELVEVTTDLETDSEASQATENSQLTSLSRRESTNDNTERENTERENTERENTGDGNTETKITEEDSTEENSTEENSTEENSTEENSTEENSTEEGSTEEDSTENESTMDLDSPDFLSEILADQGVVTQIYPVLDEELGTLRLLQLRSRQNEELGILRILRTAQAAPLKPAPPIVFLGGRLGFVDVDNVIRNNNRVEEQIYQAGTSLFLVPRISPSTSLYAIAETNVARYNNISDINYNEIQLQLGLRQRLRPRTFAQVGWRNQRLYSPGYREKLFAVNYIDAQISHRSVLSSKVWLDSFYQMRLGFAEPRVASRFRQTVTLSLNYGVTRNLRTSLLYQLDLDDYTQIPRYDTYQQVLGIVSYNLTPESRINIFGGTRFGNSSEARVNLDDTFYGAGLNISVPLF